MQSVVHVNKILTFPLQVLIQAAALVCRDELVSRTASVTVIVYATGER